MQFQFAQQHATDLSLINNKITNHKLVVDLNFNKKKEEIINNLIFIT